MRTPSSTVRELGLGGERLLGPACALFGDSGVCKERARGRGRRDGVWERVCERAGRSGLQPCGLPMLLCLVRGNAPPPPSGCCWAVGVSLATLQLCLRTCHGPLPSTSAQPVDVARTSVEAFHDFIAQARPGAGACYLELETKRSARGRGPS